jgi:hypothetical protein
MLGPGQWYGGYQEAQFSPDTWGPSGVLMRKFLMIFCLFLPSLAMAQSEINLTAIEQEQLNTFFSNFSEANLKSFKQNSLTREALLNFALEHIYKNADTSLKRSKDGSAAIIPATLVDKTTEKYFGQKIKRHEKSEYLVPLASELIDTVESALKVSSETKFRFEDMDVLATRNNKTDYFTVSLKPRG